MPSDHPLPPLQDSVDRFTRSLGMAHKLLSLHPRKKGNPGNAAALSPAVVLTSISALEGFCEDFMALAMAHSGSNYAEIAKKVGNWNNPTLADFARVANDYFLSGNLPTQDPISIFICPYVGRNTWVWQERSWTDVLEDSKSWMQVRHLLTHGLVTGWRSEWWPGPLKSQDLPAARVLRDNGGGTHSLVIHGAITCARIHSIGAQRVADAVASHLGVSLTWSSLPEFA